MCLLTYFPPGVQPDAAALRCGARCNSDGHGFGLLVPGEDEIRIGKSMDAEEVIAAFVALRAEFPHGPALFHSRLATHGETNTDNCHPFVVNGDPRTIVAHNGILGAEARPGRIGTKVRVEERAGVTVQVSEGIYDHRSDTRILADDLLMKRWANLDSRHARKRLTRWLGRGNKILVLTTDPAYRKDSYLFNADLGLWTGGIWYSNTSFRSYRGGSAGYGSGYETWWESGTSYRSGAAGVGSSEWEGYDELDDSGYDEFHYGYMKDSRGVWVPSTQDRWRNDDPAAWPVTLGGTRGAAKGAVTTFVTCDLCAAGSVDPETGLCLDCHACNDCYEYVGACFCYGAPRLTAYVYAELVKALDANGPAAMIRRHVKDYRRVCATFQNLADRRAAHARAETEAELESAVVTWLKQAGTRQLAISDRPVDLVDSGTTVSVASDGAVSVSVAG